MDSEFCNHNLNSVTVTGTIAVNGYRGRSGVVSKRSWKTISHLHTRTPAYACTYLTYSGSLDCILQLGFKVKQFLWSFVKSEKKTDQIMTNKLYSIVWKNIPEKYHIVNNTEKYQGLKQELLFKNQRSEGFPNELLSERHKLTAIAWVSHLCTCRDYAFETSWPFGG